MNILITGGASGLGAAAVIRLAQDANNNVYFTYARSRDAAEALAAGSSNIQAWHCDFTKEKSVDKLLGQMDNWDLDVLVNNAIVGDEKNYFHKIESSIFLTSFLQNILPVIKITQLFIKQARKKRFGKIITIISSAVLNRPPVGWSAYVAGKSYLLSLSKSWAIENAGYRITSNALSPSFMTTSLTADTDERIIEEMVKSHPLKALLTTTEVADSIAYLVNCPQQINGINLIINAASDLA